MKNILANFSGQVLSRGEMKDVKGGSWVCRVCSSGPLGGACGEYVLNRRTANRYAEEGNAGNDGYSYAYDCIQE